jgi:hypothetical protein
MLFPQKYFAVTNRKRLKQAIAQTKASVEDGDRRLFFRNQFTVEKYEHGEFLTQSRGGAEKKDKLNRDGHELRASLGFGAFLIFRVNLIFKKKNVRFRSKRAFIDEHMNG